MADNDFDERLKLGQSLADKIRERFGCDFVGVSVFSSPEESSHSWHCVSGNESTRYQRLSLPEGVGILGLVLQTKSPLIIDNAPKDIPAQNWYQYPIIAGEELISVAAFPLFESEVLRAIVMCGYRNFTEISDEDLARVQEAAADYTGYEYANQSARHLNPQSASPLYAQDSHRFIKAQEDERMRIARELHDGLAQELLLVQIELRKARYMPQEEIGKAIDRANEQLRLALSHISAIASGLRPASLDELGLKATIEAECKKLERFFNIRVEQSIQEVGQLNPDRELALYRIFQEATSNACKYAGSDKLKVSLALKDKSICMKIEDFGRGFDLEHPEIKGGGLGLLGMKERANAVGAKINIDSKKGSGTTVAVVLNLD
ncbi:MAG: GAF domain-containing sensor histidine kinase [Coriobacteriia bacterium]|nr:GAF domain-containing sensor histidine kinase [Coriobacteriia bacterium]